MANTLDHHAKLIIGDLVLNVARLTAENESLREQLRAATAPPPAPTGPQP